MKSTPIPRFAALLTLCLALLTLPLNGFAGQAAVAMPDRYGAAASREILEAGGNAMDAAIAAAFALAVTFPEAGNIGGGGFLVAVMNGEPVFLDFREKAPLGAHRDMYLDAEGNFVERRSLVGGLAVGVPGTVRGMEEAHKRFGSLPWKQLLEPAIRFASEGFEVHPKLGRMKDDAVEFFGDDNNFARHFSGMSTGTVFKQPLLARTLRRIAADPDDFYTGLIAQQIISQMGASGGLITAADLAQYTALWRDPLLVPWRGHQLVATPPPSSGGIALAQLLTMRDAANQQFAGVEHNSARYVHLLAEIEKRVFADRGDYLGDPDYGDVPVAELTDPEYLRRRAASINAEGISPDVMPGLEKQGEASLPLAAESVDTTHFSIMDAAGNGVALTYTQNWEFGSGVVVEGAGFLLNNQMDDFSAKVGVPNRFGVIGKDMNAIEPGKRMLSSMSPSVLMRDDRIVAVVGTPGGSTIFTSVYQVLLNLVDFDMEAEEAVAATRFHHQLPAAYKIRYDKGRELDPRMKQSLEDMGYTVEPNWWGPLGDIQLVRVNERGQLEAASDPRSRGLAEVFEVNRQAAAAD